MGASKTATSTITVLLGSILMKKCNHFLAGPWWNYKEKSQFAKFDCYGDNGDSADFDLLYSMFDDGKFIFNSRDIRSWVQSMHRHIGGIRISYNCSLTGDFHDCNEKDWVSNSRANLYSRVIKNVRFYDNIYNRHGFETDRFLFTRLKSSNLWEKQIRFLTNGTGTAVQQKISYSDTMNYPHFVESDELAASIHKQVCSKNLTPFQRWAFC